MPRPRILVEADRLDPGCDLLVYNHPEVYRMILEEEAPPAAIAAALTTYLRDAWSAGQLSLTPNMQQPTTVIPAAR
ncbi:hypothetical protein [Yinghuangia soli]|uniref:Uncharacterized protein n=1 Tax=Yinghuangia soli TaxID=2908204 RepID=A0AA41Q7E2_9ACTN|nr:hypothetical protein [Yinghuangia soli]MCF2531714.1 hypothetical protein [Yinghuangia soli]